MSIKNPKHLMLLAAVALLTLAACKKEEIKKDEDKIVNEEEPGIFRAVITGSPTGKDSISITGTPHARAHYKQGTLSIVASASGLEFRQGEQSARLFISPAVYNGPGTYVFDGSGESGGFYAEDDKTHTFDAYKTYGSGSVTIISKTDKRVTGSFEFTAENSSKTTSITLSSGTFDVPVIEDKD